MARLGELASGLVYSSEGDHPLETVHFGPVDLPTDADDAAMGALRALLSLPADTPVRFVSLERALGRHTVFTDPLDLEAQAIRPRYEAIVRLFEDELIGSVVARTGHAPAIDVWMLGRTADGELVGYHTVAIET
jgi:hypothetical protein